MLTDYESIYPAVVIEPAPHASQSEKASICTIC